LWNEVGAEHDVKDPELMSMIANQHDRMITPG